MANDMAIELRTLYTYAGILSKLKDGDSLTDIQMKTKFSYTTISKSVKILEETGIIRTEEELTKHGKERKCFILKPAKEQSYSFLNEMKKYKNYLNGGQELQSG